jgi:hypothetical protein
MRVLADLYGGDIDSLKARAEFQEIKDKVIQEVCHTCFFAKLYLTFPIASIRSGKDIWSDVENVQTARPARNVLAGICSTGEVYSELDFIN